MKLYDIIVVMLMDYYSKNSCNTTFLKKSAAFADLFVAFLITKKKQNIKDW